jgi:hypothetical protein
MNGTLGVKKLGERLDCVLAEGVNVGKIWASFQGGGIFKKIRGLVVINDGVHCRKGCRGSHMQEGAIEQLVIRTVSADA